MKKLILLVTLLAACGQEHSKGNIETGDIDKAATVFLVNETIHSFCAATFIGPSRLITAAHCLNKEHKYYVKMSAQLFDDKASWYWVTKVDRDLRYDPENIKGGHDLGFVEIEEMQPHAAAISLNEPEIGDEVTLVSMRNFERKVFITEITDINDTSILTPSITCHGDSGGPLYMNGAIVGIVSYGDEGCAELSVYSRITR